MRYLSHTPEDREEMLQAVGASSIDDLFSVIPESCRCKGELDLPPALSEWKLVERLTNMSMRMAAPPDYNVFVGAGSYHHHIPAIVPYLIGRSEFCTSYTPYQPEISQGTLQTIYEYQTLTSRLLGMEVANASMYDGASALAEALLMAIRVAKGKRKTVAISSLIHPYYRKVVKTYFAPTDFEIVEMPYLKSGVTDLSKVEKIQDLAAIAVQSPNFFGCIEDLRAVSDKARQKEALSVATFTEPLAFGLIKNPGEQGADIACGEGQSLGIPQSFGGPGLGMFASLNKHVRNLPGRLVGKTVDRDGKRGFVLTLATREQHIRREKATSNICSNQGLCASMCVMYMAALGGTGIRRLAGLNRDKAEYLKRALKRQGIGIPFERPTFNEFVAAFPDGFQSRYQDLLKKKIVAGIPLECHYPELKNHYLLCATETVGREDMDALAKEVAS